MKLEQPDKQKLATRSSKSRRQDSPLKPFSNPNDGARGRPSLVSEGQGKVRGKAAAFAGKPRRFGQSTYISLSHRQLRGRL
jgi:hypothetical protein